MQKKFYVIVYGFGDIAMWCYIATDLLDAIDYHRSILDAFGEAEIKHRYVK